MGIALAVLCAVLYSANYIFIQLGMRKSKKDNGDYLSLAACVLTVLLIYAVSSLWIDRGEIPFSMRGMLFFMLAGFSTAYLGRNFLLAGIRRIGSPRAAALKNSAPIFVTIVAVLFMGERISPGAGVGMAVIFAALFLQARSDFRKAGSLVGKEARTGFMLALVSAVFFGLGQAARKQGVIDYPDPIFGSLIGTIFALLVFTLMEASKKRLAETWRRNFTRLNPYFIAAGIATGIAQISFFVSLMHTHVSYTSTIAALEPIFTVLLSKWFLSKEEKITWRIGLTACSVFLGTYLIILAM
jgi:drug/metabolite transporter (DMT)-like permease